MRQCEIFVKGVFAGVLTETDGRKFEFTYDGRYLADDALPPVSLTLPKRKEPYYSDSLFSCFFNILSEGENRRFQSQLLHIDEKDDFGILLETAQSDTIGCLTVKPIR
ncbi:MAG: HipA N-terminal domain-containing protein [Bacteroidales bacterium]|nr:HipA N-terminal domain-containing protein [Bacteroidales bacterium]